MELVRPVWENLRQSIGKIQDYSEFYNNPDIIKTMIHGNVFDHIAIQATALSRWMEYTKHKPNKIDDVIEFGGGFGAMCQCLLPFITGDYTIIDLPEIIKLQEWYLNSFSENNGYYENPIDWIRANLIDDFYLNIKWDMFISCYSLNEAGEDLIRKIIDSKFFGAEKLLIICNKLPDDQFVFDKFIPELREQYNIIEYNEVANAIFK